MDTSRYFERTLFHDRSPAADEYYARSAESVFETNPEQCKIEVRIQSSLDASYYEAKAENGASSSLKDGIEINAGASAPYNDRSADLKAAFSDCRKETASKIKCTRNAEVDESLSTDSDSDGTWSLSSKASSTALSSALDQHQGPCPPTYPGPPKLNVVELDAGKVQSFVRRTKGDFRVFYLRQRHSYSRLQITKELFEQLLTSCHVFPRFNEYLIGFGLKTSESEVGPPPLKFRPLCSSHNNSYHGFECSYILRYIEFTNRSRGKRPWSLRQFAVYHRYKPKSKCGCSTWILVGASQRTEVRLDRYTRSIDDLMGSNPFELHVIFLDTAIASWRPYLVDLTKLVTYQSNKAVGISVGRDEDEDNFISICFEDHQELKQIEDQIADLILCLDSTLDTVSTFMEMYDQFRDQQDIKMRSDRESRQSAYGSDAVIFALREKAKEIAYTRKKAGALLEKVQNTRTLISSLLGNQQMSAIHKLEIQGQEESMIMRQLAEKNSRDSSSMRILTIITMIYLPCTIVSNFYSTQFVNVRELPSGDTKLEYTANTYIFFAISIPLTFITILVWYFWMNSKSILRLLQCQSFRKTHELAPGTTEYRIRLPRRSKSEWAASSA
ncbi:hypothetical protein K458DRAFT_9680 [Lentithecium fluviatile CBS 122367]|uniref:CorA-like transporter domain-containing protein n=1 Tax=Lentithecium fluviatile CBS 122367 TaxID=1168545 RepID=A0A6G1JNM3_9PLEO|nr:hypothetical protein K458DRAFT_9680 [Lentithecium fluviatile CBS 122367]